MTVEEFTAKLTEAEKKKLKNSNKNWAAGKYDGMIFDHDEIMEYISDALTDLRQQAKYIEETIEKLENYEDMDDTFEALQEFCDEFDLDIETVIENGIDSYDLLS